MDPNGSFFKLIYLIDMVYEAWTSYRYVHKGILLIMQGCIRVSEYYL